MTPRLLMIEDDRRLAQMVAEYLGQSGFEVAHAPDGEQGLEQLRLLQPQMVILDLMMPGIDGLEVCRRIRALPDELARTPVLMLTAKGDPMDRIVGLEIGADDYLPKPFEPRELVARLQTVLRRRRASLAPQHTAPDPTNGELRFEGLTLDPARRSVVREGQDVELTGTEFELLLLLAREPGKVFSRDDILNQLRGHEAELYTRAVDIVVSRLRKKLEPLDCIKTLRNAGYSLALRRVPS